MGPLVSWPVFFDVRIVVLSSEEEVGKEGAQKWARDGGEGGECSSCRAFETRTRAVACTFTRHSFSLRRPNLDEHFFFAKSILATSVFAHISKSKIAKIMRIFETIERTNIFGVLCQYLKIKAVYP
jgi:hypothetical protein